MLAEIEPHLAAIGRTERSARDAANLALFAVRAHQQKRDAGAARAAVLAALRLQPDLVPNVRMHPPNVVELVQRVRDELSRGETGLLSLVALPSDPDGCTVRLNGRPVGLTPEVRVTVPPGTYQVQIECSDNVTGRIHRVLTVGNAPTRVQIAARLAQSLQSRPAPALVYGTPEDLAESLPLDLEVLARTLSVERLMVAVHDGRRIELRAFRVTQAGAVELTGTGPVPEPVDDVASRSAVEVAVGARPTRAAVSATAELTEASATPVEGSATSAQGPASTGRPIDVGLTIAGGTVLGAGLVALGLTWYFWSELETRGFEITATGDPQIYASRIRAFRDGTVVPWALGAAGAAAAVLGISLLLPPEPEVPWWSYVLGAGGAAIAGAGIYFLVTPGSCYANTAVRESCAERYPNDVLGALLLEHAVPFLSVPLVHAVRAATTSQVNVTPTAGGLEVRGTF